MRLNYDTLTLRLVDDEADEACADDGVLERCTKNPLLRLKLPSEEVKDIVFRLYTDKVAVVTLPIENGKKYCYVLGYNELEAWSEQIKQEDEERRERMREQCEAEQRRAFGMRRKKHAWDDDDEDTDDDSDEEEWSDYAIAKQAVDKWFG